MLSFYNALEQTVSKFGGLLSAHTRENPGNQLGNFETSQLKLHTDTDVQFGRRRFDVDHRFADSKAQAWQKDMVKCLLSVKMKNAGP